MTSNSVRNRPASSANPVAAFSALAIVFLTALFAGPVLADTGPGTPGVIPDGFMGIEFQIDPRPSCPDTVTSVRFVACRCNVQFQDAGKNAQGVVVLHAQVQPSVVCVQCDPDTVYVPLGKFAAGSYSQAVEILADVVDSSGVVHTATGNFNVPFIVAPTCNPRPFPGTILPYLDEVVIGRAAICRPCPQIACAGDSIPVHLAGHFPTTCVTLESVKVVPSPVVGPQPEPDEVQITYGINSCSGQPCGDVIGPWEADVKISALPPMPYGLVVMTSFDDHCTPGSPRPFDEVKLPFVVTVCDSLPPPPPRACFDARFVQSKTAMCDAFIAPGHPAQVTYEIAPTVSLAGLQGALRFNAPGYNISSIQTTGAASSMQLFWNPDPDGAHFILYSDQGHLIPPQTPIWTSPWEPILEVTVEQFASEGLGQGAVRLDAQDLLASDSVGAAVPHCPLVLVPDIEDRAATICPAGQASECDVNHDGRADVRDLVIMAMCISGFGACPDTSNGALDCDGNGVVDLADVMCCAHHILDQKPPAGDGQGEDDSHIALEMGLPRPATGGCDVPLTLHGMSTLGAARLDLSFPSDRYDVTGVDLPSSPGWLSLSQKGDGTVAVAWIAAGSVASQTDVEYATLHLQLKAGAKEGGDLTVSASQFASKSGGALRVSAAGMSLPLSGGRVALSSPLPNPAGGRTSFSVTLAQPGALDVGVFDAGGRRIATLFHGDAPAGARMMSWGGRRDTGVAARSGLFFVRAESAGTKVTQKVMLLSPR
jgi:hypothetical protein